MHFSQLRIAQLLTFIFHKNSFNLYGHFFTMPYKISSANIFNLSYVGESFHEEISCREGNFTKKSNLCYYKVIIILKKIKLIYKFRSSYSCTVSEIQNLY